MPVDLQPAVIRSFAPGPPRLATVRLASGLANVLATVAVAPHIPAADLTAGRECLVAFTEPHDITAATVVAITGPTDDTPPLSVAIDGGGEAIVPGVRVHAPVPFDSNIAACRLYADQTGSIKIDLWLCNQAAYPPDNEDTITGGNEPEISADDFHEDTTLTSWTTALAKGQVIAYNVDSCTTITRCTVALDLRRT